MAHIPKTGMGELQSYKIKNINQIKKAEQCWKSCYLFDIHIVPVIQSNGSYRPEADFIIQNVSCDFFVFFTNLL